MNDAQVPEWLGRLADANKRIAELERIIGKQEEELHQKELRVAELEAKLKWAMGLNACIEHERAEQTEAELASLKGRHEWTMREWERLHDTTTSHWSVADVEARWQARAEEGGGE